MTRGLLAVLLFASTAAAAEGAGAHHGPSIGELLFPVINFSIFLFILWRFAWPGVLNALAERRRTIESRLSEAAAVHAKAEAGLAEVRELRDRQSAEAERLLSEVREEAELQAANIVESARETAERIRRDARTLGEQESRRAVGALRTELAVEVVARASELARQRIGEAEHRTFVDEFLEGVRKAA